MRTLTKYFLLLLCIALSPNAQAYSLGTTALINNGGDLGKTLDDMGKSQNVRALLTAGVRVYGNFFVANQAVIPACAGMTEYLVG